MLSATGGNTLVYTGTLAPAGSQLPPDTQVSLSSSDPTVQPTVDSTNLVVTIPLPTGFVDNPVNLFTVKYNAASAANPNWSLSATITPSAPVTLPTSIVFNQTT
jgi:hypothetical protein